MRPRGPQHERKLRKTGGQAAKPAPATCTGICSIKLLTSDFSKEARNQFPDFKFLVGQWVLDSLIL